MFFAPIKAGMKVSATLRVSIWPEKVTLEPAPFKEHCEFCCAPLPGVMDVAGNWPESVSRDSSLRVRSYDTAHAPFAPADVPIIAPTLLKLAGPPGSEN